MSERNSYVENRSSEFREKKALQEQAARQGLSGLVIEASHEAITVQWFSAGVTIARPCLSLPKDEDFCIALACEVCLKQVKANQAAAKKLLGVPEEHLVRTVISPGYSDEEARRRRPPVAQARKPVESIVHWERFQMR